MTKQLSIQCLNIDCPKCGSLASFDCRHNKYGSLLRPHDERVWAMQTLIEESKHDWIMRKILRERNFSK